MGAQDIIARTLYENHALSVEYGGMHASGFLGQLDVSYEDAEFSTNAVVQDHWFKVNAWAASILDALKAHHYKVLKVGEDD